MERFLNVNLYFKIEEKEGEYTYIESKMDFHTEDEEMVTINLKNLIGSEKKAYAKMFGVPEENIKQIPREQYLEESK